MTAPLDPALLAFRPLVAADFPALHGWFNAPHARRWFGKKGPALVIDPEDGTTPLHLMELRGT
jgi:hypothetical protein